MSWIESFYHQQGEWAGLYRGPPQPYHHQKVRRLRAQVSPPGPILELGAGGGQHAALTADAGYTITAVELVASSAANIRTLAASRPSLTAIQGDFYTLSLPDRFQAVCYWDGFGVGGDADQRRLLTRIADEWLTPDGVALIDVYTPWSAAKSVGRGGPAGAAKRTYGYNAAENRWLDTWSNGEHTVTQSLRCYSPADLQLLLEGTGLVLQDVSADGGMEWETMRWNPTAPLEEAMMYTARLTKTHATP